MKKILSFLLLAALTLMLFMSCEDAHTHTASAWTCDLNEHWRVCNDDGERMDIAKHTFDFFDTCEVCGCRVIDWGDEKDLNVYDEKGNMILSATYDASGNIVSEQKCEYVYVEDCNLISAKCYYDGKLYEEKNYALGGDGVYETKTISYEENGTRKVYEYDAYGELILFEAYDANGAFTAKTVTEYAENEDGDRYEVKSTEYDYEANQMYIAEYNAYEDQTSRTICDLNGNVKQTDVFEYGYNEDGDWIWKKDYTDGVLVTEYLDYTTHENEDYSMRYPKTVVEYREDGSRLVTENGTDGNPVKETLYNADGTVESVTNVTEE